MEECRKTSGIQVSAEPLELSVGGVLKLQLLSWVAQGCFGDTHMQAPLVATRAAARPAATTRGHIHPPLDLAPDEIDIHAIANIPRMIARGTPCEGRAQVVPVRVPAGITRRVVGFPQRNWSASALIPTLGTPLRMASWSRGASAWKRCASPNC